MLILIIVILACSGLSSFFFIEAGKVTEIRKRYYSPKITECKIG